jgi:hypothetical protein
MKVECDKPEAGSCGSTVEPRGRPRLRAFLTKRMSAKRCHRSNGVLFFPAHIMFARQYVCLGCKRPISRLLTRTQNQYLHASPPLTFPRRKDFFSSNAYLKQKQQPKANEPIEPHLDSQKQLRRGSRLPAAPTSLRRVAVEAQRSKDGILSKALLREQGLYRTKVVKIEGLHLHNSFTNCSAISRQ